MEIGIPVVEQVVQNRKQLLFGWIPRFQQIVIELNVIDGFNGGIGVRVGCEERPLGVWIEFDRLLERFHAIHFRHAMIHKEKRHSIIPELHPAQEIQSGAPGIGSQDAVAIFVVLLQVAFDRAEDVRIVIHRQYDWLTHSDSTLFFAVGIQQRRAKRDP